MYNLASISLGEVTTQSDYVKYSKIDLFVQIKQIAKDVTGA